MDPRVRALAGLCGLAVAALVVASPRVGAEGFAVERAALAAQPEARVALQESIERRERELRSEKRGRIVTQVRQRARELGIVADPEALADRLFDRARLVLERDRCLLAELPTAACASVEPALVLLEADFHRLSGWTAADFKSGRRDKGLPPTGVPGAAVRSYSPDHCRCSALVYSRDRFLNRYWGLECNGHAGHGVCSTNLDSFHTAGTGAMTGAIDVFFGSSLRGRDCPDDHRTCFKGPKPSKTNGGEWGNVCNCDTWHSQSSNPFGAWYSGDLTDAAEVWQGSFYEMVTDGDCEGQWISVSEFIEENDPIYCDDAMGTLWASAPVGNGHRESYVPASAQNCNGGSQSGVPPYCGTFGATIRIVTDCQTVPDYSDASCYNRCNQDPPEASCSCSVDCDWLGNCCNDYRTFCYY